MKIRMKDMDIHSMMYNYSHEKRPKTESRGNNESFDSLCEGTAQCDSNGSLELGGYISTR